MSKPSISPDLDALLSHCDWVRALARSLAADSADADDLEQKTWLAAIEHPPSSLNNPRAWLGRVVRNFANMNWRENQSRRRREERFETRRSTKKEHDGLGSEPQQLVERMEAVGKLAQAMVNLPPPYGATIFLRFYEELSYLQIAERMNVSASVAKDRTTRALEMLRQQLGTSLGSDWKTCCLLLSVPLQATNSATITTLVTMKTKLVFAAALVALLSLLPLLDWTMQEKEVIEPLQIASLAQPIETELIPVDAQRPNREAEGVLGEIAESSEFDANLDLRGIVVDSLGNPVPSAAIFIFQPVYRQIPRVRPDSADPIKTLIAELQSDLAGEFCVRLEPGKVFDLDVNATGFGSQHLLNLYAGESLRIELTAAATVRGTVRDAETGLPIANAQVLARRGVLGTPGRTSRETETDGHGEFEFTNLPADYFTINAYADGYVYGVPSSVSRELLPGQLHDLDILLAKGSLVFGRITDGVTKQPIEGAVVRTLKYSIEQSATTDAEGRYQLAGIDPEARERIYAIADGYGRYDWTITDRIPDAGLEVNLGLLPGRKARGRIVDEQGNPISGAYVSANLNYRRPDYGDTQTDARYTRTDENGDFEFEDLRVDLRHSLHVAAEGFGAEVFDFPAAEWESLDLDLGEIALHPAAGLSGRVINQEGNPVAGIWVTLTGESDRRDALGPVPEGGAGYSSEGGFGLGSTLARTDQRGRYAFQGLPAGEFFLWAGAKGYARGAEAQLHLDAGSAMVDFDLTLDSGAFIRGVVVDTAGRPIPGASVSVHQPKMRSRRVAYNLCASDGSFFVAGLENQEYDLRCDEGFHGLVDASGQRRRFSEIMLESIAAGSEGIRIVLPSAQASTGIVLGPEGTPVSHAIVYERDHAADGTWTPLLATSGQHGQFTIWIDEGSSKEVFVYPSLHDPNNQYGVWQYDAEGKVDFSFEVAATIPAGAVDFVIQLPKLPPSE